MVLESWHICTLMIIIIVIVNQLDVCERCAVIACMQSTYMYS